MDCPEIKARLSAYHDNELSADETAQVAAHVAKCSSCAVELSSFEQLSGLSRRLTDPPVPAHMWAELQANLDSPATPSTGLFPFLPHKRFTRPFALAASVFIAVGIGILGYFNWVSHDEHHLAMNFAHYLEEFEESPDAAQQILLANYDGRPTTLTEATNVLGYEPVAAKRLPPGYSVDKTYLLKMPCCTCAQVVCKNQAGNAIAVFEHNIDQPVWFGDKPSVECLCHDIPTSVVQFGGRLAASWQEGPRYITIIGATDLDEVTNFVAHFSGAASTLN